MTPGKLSRAAVAVVRRRWPLLLAILLGTLIALVMATEPVRGPDWLSQSMAASDDGGEHWRQFDWRASR